MRVQYGNTQKEIPSAPEKEWRRGNEKNTQVKNCTSHRGTNIQFFHDNCTTNIRFFMKIVHPT